MGKRNLLSFIAASTVALAISGSASAVVINVTFTPRWNDVNNWPGATPVDRAQNQGRATSDVLQAKSNWETAITDNFNLDVTVDWNLPMAFGNQDSQVCGVGGVLTSQVVGGVTKPATSRIILNSVLNNWFFDPTPAQHEEFDSVPNQPWKGTAKAGGPAKDKVDMVSCAKHEFGHALGFMYDPGNQFQPYINEVADGDIDVNDFGGIALPVGALNNQNTASHFSDVGNVPDPALLVAVPMDRLLMVPEAGPEGDERTVMSPYDVSGVAKILGLPLGIGYNLIPKETVPEPTSASVALIALSIVGSHRRHARRAQRAK